MLIPALIFAAIVLAGLLASIAAAWLTRGADDAMAEAHGDQIRVPRLGGGDW